MKSDVEVALHQALQQTLVMREKGDVSVGAITSLYNVPTDPRFNYQPR
jgi:hypothetical protein